MLQRRTPEKLVSPGDCPPIEIEKQRYSLQGFVGTELVAAVDEFYR